jgi:phenylacetate-CoA ligase
MFWDEKNEAMSRDEMQVLQLSRLQATLDRAYSKIPFYKKKFDDAGVKPAEIKTLNDLKSVPFTTKNDLRDNYPFGMFAEPLDDIVRVHASSGTTGQVTVVGYTATDIDTWAELVTRCIVLSGGTKKDIIQVAYGYGLFTGGLGLHYGGEKLGAMVIPMSGGNTKRQIQVMKDFGSTILCCTPSYALYMGEVAAEMGIDFKQLNLKAGIFGAEPWSESMRQEIEAKLNLKAYDIYGLSEVIGPGVANECEVQQGLHVFEDHFIPEVIDPDSGEVLGPGEQGELVITTITKEATPVIRYRTKDVTSLNFEPCACGRTHARMQRVFGRSDDMLIIRGVNVFPSQIEEILMSVEGTEPHYQIIVDRQKALDEVEIQVEVAADIFSDEIKRLAQLSGLIEQEIREDLGIGAKVTLVEPKTIQRSEGKAKRLVDKRDLAG